MSAKNGKYKVCPECGSRMESVDIGEHKDGVTYHKTALECIGCGYTDLKRSRKNRSSIRDWNLTD